MKNINSKARRLIKDFERCISYTGQDCLREDAASCAIVHSKKMKKAFPHQKNEWSLMILELERILAKIDN